ncbi:MAG: AraC family transcriptional regulator [Bradyrhizobium sp.]
MAAELQQRHAFRGIPRSLAVAIGYHSIRLTNSTAQDLGSDILLYSEPQDAVAMIYQLDDLPAHDLWLDGRHHRIKAVPRLTMHILNLDAHCEARLGPTFDSINVQIPRAALKAFAEMSGSPKADSLHVDAEWSTVDPVVNILEPGLRFALSDPNGASRLVQEHLTFALIAHLATAYGTMKTDQSLMPGRLAYWQVRRAKELLTADLSGEVSLAEISLSCRLSPSHFSRVFKATTGLSPFAWRQWYRIEVAKQMLRQREKSLAEVALACGFADQSHFTRAFSRRTGSTPAGWRRGGGC